MDEARIIAVMARAIYRSITGLDEYDYRDIELYEMDNRICMKAAAAALAAIRAAGVDLAPVDRVARLRAVAKAIDPMESNAWTQRYGVDAAMDALQPGDLTDADLGGGKG